MLAIPDQHVKVRIQKQYDIFSHTFDVQWGRLSLWLICRVHEQCRLDHHDAVFYAFPHQTGPLEDRFVWRTIECINYVAPSQMVGILRKQFYRWLQSEGMDVVSVVLCKSYGKFEQSPIQPSFDFETLFDISLMRCHTS